MMWGMPPSIAAYSKVLAFVGVHHLRSQRFQGLAPRHVVDVGWPGAVSEVVAHASSSGVTRGWGVRAIRVWVLPVNTTHLP